MAQLSLNVVTPERLVFQDQVDTVTLMTETGEITVLPGHLPLVTILRPGEMRLKKGGTESLLVVSTGFFEVRPGNQLFVLADTAEHAEELELEKIEGAKKAAERLMEEKRHVDDVAFAHAAAMLERELARYKVAVKKRHHPSA
ncbi:ATP synthase F1 subunit epsilon [Candidatus Uhrbacteria bacterium]|nr:ATP synthase F1 subunit epsilon [Candidatus Uhrbacteria bacterium]